jgi:hypothetical protein
MTTSTTSAPDQQQSTPATAADEAQHVAGVAAGEARSVAGDARDQARQLIDETMQQVNEHGSAQRDRLVELLRGLSSDLHEMAEKSQSNGVASTLVQQGADRADDLSSRLDGHELSDLVAEVRGFARRRPGTFLLGALAAGVVVGRFARGAKAAQDEPDTGAVPAPSTSSPEPLYDDLAAGSTPGSYAPSDTDLAPTPLSPIPGNAAGDRP